MIIKKQTEKTKQKKTTKKQTYTYKSIYPGSIFFFFFPFFPFPSFLSLLLLLLPFLLPFKSSAPPVTTPQQIPTKALLQSETFT